MKLDLKKIAEEYCNERCQNKGRLKNNTDKCNINCLNRLLALRQTIAWEEITESLEKLANLILEINMIKEKYDNMGDKEKEAYQRAYGRMSYKSKGATMIQPKTAVKYANELKKIRVFVKRMRKYCYDRNVAIDCNWCKYADKTNKNDPCPLAFGDAIEALTAIIQDLGDSDAKSM